MTYKDESVEAVQIIGRITTKCKLRIKQSNDKFIATTLGGYRTEGQSLYDAVRRLEVRLIERGDLHAR